ncbi:MAG: hypothetical protein ABMA13_23525, partial [Chthoniobacteraceae bacterium]
MSTSNRSLGLAALGWWLASRGLAEPIEESFSRLDPSGVQRLGKASRLAALVAARRLAQALRDEPGYGGGELFSGSNAWLDRLETVLNAPRAGYRMEKALAGDAEDFALLLETELPADRAVILAARLAEWLHAQVGANDEPAAVADFLAQGWPIAPGADRHVSYLQEFQANLHAELSDAPPEITMPLGDPGEFLAWLDSEAGQHVSVAETAPGIPPPAPPSDPTDERFTASASVAPVPDHATAVAEIHEQATRERRRLRIGALLFQVGWLAVMVVAWQLFQKRRKV